MEVIFVDLQNIGLLQKHKYVFTIGNFDGVHRGHKQLIQLTKVVANNFNTGWGVITFIPNTKNFFDSSYQFLNTLDQKLNYFRQLKVPLVLIMNFAQIHMLDSQKFIQDYLIDVLQAKALVVGNNFKFGNDLFCFNKGNNECKTITQLTQQEDLKYFKTKFKADKNLLRCLNNVVTYTSNNLAKIHFFIINGHNIDGKMISSSNIKNLLQNGNIRMSNKLLGYNFVVTSEVIHGNKLGRNLGFPTINMLIPSYVRLKHGIYATRAVLPNSEIKDAVSNFGIRPTIANSNKQEILETYIFDYNADLYGQRVSIEFIDYIREEKKFSSLNDLVKAIKEDVHKAKIILSFNKDNNNHDN